MHPLTYNIKEEECLVVIDLYLGWQLGDKPDVILAFKAIFFDDNKTTYIGLN